MDSVPNRETRKTEILIKIIQESDLIYLDGMGHLLVLKFIYFPTLKIHKFSQKKKKLAFGQ